ncbi:hypothetical protein NDU88_011845, partial [Pleurodeles waltl]
RRQRQRQTLDVRVPGSSRSRGGECAGHDPTDRRGAGAGTVEALGGVFNRRFDRRAVIALVPQPRPCS